MNTYKEIIVVEGKSDTKRLKSFFNVETIETNGLGINKDIIELIKVINDKRGVILLLDPDGPGEKIRKRINEEIPNLKNAFITEDSRNKNKVGVEHASKKELEDALNNLLTYSDNNEDISINDLYSLGLIGKDNSGLLREKIAKKYHIGRCNSKTFHKRINMLGLNYEDIKECLNDF